jgi:nitroreductase
MTDPQNQIPLDEISNLDEIISSRCSIRRYKDKIPPAQDIKKLIDSAVAAPSACNFQLWEFIYVTDPKKLAALAKHATQKIEWGPAVIVAVNDPRITKGRQAGLLSLGMALENLMLKATELGLATCPMAGFRGDEKIRQILDIPEEYEIPLMLLVGYPDETPPKSYRSKSDEVLHHEKFTEKRPMLQTSIHLDKWTAAGIWEYRRRIFSVYSRQLKLSFFDEENTEKIWTTISKKITNLHKKIRTLYIYPWDNLIIEPLKKLAQPLTLLCQNKELVQHYAKHFSANESPVEHEHFKFESKSDHGFTSDTGFTSTGDLAILLNKLELEPEPEKLLKNIHKNLSVDGTFILSTFRKKSLYIRALRLGIFFKHFPDVYHYSPFYRWGPVKFYSHRQLKKMLARAGFQIQSKEKVQLNLTKNLLRLALPSPEIEIFTLRKQQ